MATQVGAENERIELAASSAFGPTVQVLFPPELLSMVFSFSQRADLATSARVCKRWSDNALDHLWRDLQSVFPLLELVFDINLIKREHDSFMYKKLADALGDMDWDRFHSYGKRVRSLKFDERLTYRNDLDTPDLDFTVMGVVCLRHPFGGVLLPNLRKLHWISDAEGSALAILPFLSGELGELDLQMSTYATSTANDVLKAIAERAPTLVTFSLGTKLPKVFVEKALMVLLQTTGSLEKILLPPDYLTPALIQILGSLPKLKEIDEGPRLPYPRHSPGVLPPLHPGAFPHLTNITFSATLPDARKFLFASQEIASRLQYIVLHASGALDPGDILSFARHVAQNCPLMNHLGLDLFKKVGSGEQPVSPLTMALLESLYPCTRLGTLEVGHPRPFTFQEDDVERIGRAWPHMTSLDVCSDPDFSFPVDQMGSSLSILSRFAKALPKLEALAIFLGEQEAQPLADNFCPQYQFQNLTELHVGLSYVPGGPRPQVGAYIASLCKIRPFIECGATECHIGELPRDWANTETAWKEVEEAVGLAMKVKQMGLQNLV